ncbi:MAG: C1 family peptidase [Cetobacterium sp.]
MIDKKKLITKPQNQYNCGSCFAMAVATCINDVFIVSGQSSQNLDNNDIPLQSSYAFKTQSFSDFCFIRIEILYS